MNLSNCNRRRLLAALFVYCSAAVLVIVNGQPTRDLIDDNIDVRELISTVDELRARVASLERQQLSASATTSNKPEDYRRACKFVSSTNYNVRNFLSFFFLGVANSAKPGLDNDFEKT